MEDGDDTERSGNRTDRSDHRPHCGRDFGDSVADAPSRNQPRGMAERTNSQGVSDGKADVEIRHDDVLSAGVRPGDLDGAGVGNRDLAKPALTGGQAKIQDRQPVPAFDSVNFPVQDEKSLPVENKALPAQPVQVGNSLSPVACPDLASWRQADGIWLPRYFTTVPHLKYERVVMTDDLKPVLEKRTGLQIQWNTTCPTCQKRFRPVAGFITILHLERMREMNDDEQQHFVANIIREKFAAGVSNQHPKCIG